MSKPAKNVLELPLADRGLLALKAAIEKVIKEQLERVCPFIFGVTANSSLFLPKNWPRAVTESGNNGLLSDGCTPKKL